MARAPTPKRFWDSPPAPKKSEGAITERQLEALTLIGASIQERGVPPTIRELGQRFGMSTNAITCFVVPLEAKGLLRIDRTLTSRNIFPTDKGWGELGVKPGCCPHCGGKKGRR